MDKTIHRAFKNRTPPFTESFKTIYLYEPLQIPALLSCTIHIVNFLTLRFPNIEIYRFDDWHSHDGFITSSKAWNYQKIWNSLKTEETFIKSSHEDYEVYWTFYPDNLEFMFRYYINGEDREGCLDFSATTISINEFRQSLKPGLNELMEEESAYDFFKKTNAV